jgi:hypothetical protein
MANYTSVLTSDQWFDLVIMLASMVLIFSLWKTKVCLPFKLLTVFMHELGHASMALLCCGKVTSLTVADNESGLTNYTYSKECVKFWVTPAGYIGSSVIGAAFIIASSKLLGALICSGILAFILLLSLIFQKNWIPRVLTAVFVGIVVILFIIHFTGADPFGVGVRIFCLFEGVMNALYSVWDIWDDTIARVVRGSDATECARICGCPESSQMIGFIWIFFSFSFFVVACVIHIIIVDPYD